MPRPAAPDQFWMVSRKPREGEAWGNPRKRHSSYASARAEAQRLANQTGEPFLILWTVNEMTPAEDIPPAQPHSPQFRGGSAPAGCLPPQEPARLAPPQNDCPD